MILRENSRNVLLISLVAPIVMLSAFVDGGFVRRLAMALAIILLLIPTGGAGVKIKKSELFLGLFACWLMISTLWTEAPVYMTSVISDYLGFLACMVMVGRLADAGRKSYEALSVAYILGALVAAFQVIQAWGQGISFEGSGRFTVGEINSNYIAYTIASAFPVLAVFSLRSSAGRSMGIIAGYFAIMFLMIFAVSLTGSRGALVSIFLVILIWGLRAFRKRFFVFFSAMFVFFLIAVLLIDYLPEQIRVRLIMGEVGGVNNDIMTGRSEIWGAAFGMIGLDPIKGLGVGAFQFINDGVAPHNLILGLLLDAGVVGFLLYFAWLFFALFSRRNATDSYLFFSSSVFIVYWIPIAMTGVWIISPAICVVLALMASKSAKSL
ncbi:MAG: O-antigen ligase family protein [Pseudomonadota bacterium]